MGADMTWMQIGMVAFWLVLGTLILMGLVRTVFDGEWGVALVVIFGAVFFIALIIFGVIMTGRAWSMG
jgi:hypothetical protein